jgi:hypothetical protein
MFVSVGSGSNAGERMGKFDPVMLEAWTSQHPLGASWGNETDRAGVLVFDPNGRNRRIYATGIRNCVGLAVGPNGDVGVGPPGRRYGDAGRRALCLGRCRRHALAYHQHGAQLGWLATCHCRA